MIPFLIQYIDAFIPTIAGLILTFIGNRTPAAGKEQTNKVFRIVGPFLVGAGLLQFIAHSPTAPQWERVRTDDGVASAEFPGRPLLNERSQSIEGQTVSSKGWTYRPPAKDVDLRLSYSDSPPEDASVPDVERFEFTKNYFSSKGYHVLTEGPMTFGERSGYVLEMESADGKVRMWTRFIYAGTRVYKLVAATGPGFHDEATVPQFVDSFKATAPK